LCYENDVRTSASLSACHDVVAHVVITVYRRHRLGSYSSPSSSVE
jgi:hypothetical protein